MARPVDAVSAPSDAAVASLATRVIRKLPPPSSPSESASFPERAVAEILRAFRRERGGLWLWRGEGVRLELAAALPVLDLPQALEPVATAARGEANADTILEPGVLADLAARRITEFHPLSLPGRLIGLLGVGAPRLAGWETHGDGAEIATVASYLAGLLGGDLLTRRIRETDFELRYRLWQLESLHDIGLAIGGSLDAETIVDEVLLRALSLLNARRGSVDLLSAADGALHRDFGGTFLDEGTIVAASQGKSIRRGASDEGGIPHLAVPLRTDRRTYGVLAVAEKETRSGGVGEFELPDLHTLTLLASQMALALESSHLHREALEKERIEREIEVAASIQREILPKAPPALPGFDLAGRTIPTRVVGGDYFDYLVLPDGRLAVVVADVSGKGIPASLLVSTLATGLHLALADPFDPLDAVERLDRHLLRFSAARKFVTLAIAVFDVANDRLEFVSAGHNPMIVQRADGSLEEIGSTGVPLGLVEGSRRTSRTVTFRSGDRLCLYSDGITEALDVAGEEYGEKRLRELLEAFRNEPAERVCDRVFDDVARHATGAAQYDDQTLLIAARSSS